MLDQTRRLPLFVALTAFALYACTMGSGVTLTGLPLTAKLAGWDEAPVAGQPLLWLVTLPLQILPAAWVPLVLKLLSAALAAAILGLLARTLQLLPWDRAWDGASRFTVMLPILTAGAVCGLEFSFWQEATSVCGELLDLLPLAAALWLLLEYKARRNPRWLSAATVVWGLGMAENWLMMLTLPLYIGGLIWLMRLRFFRWKFMLRMAGLGLAGFSIYALLPLVNGLSPHSPWTFGQAWLASLHQTKNMCLFLYYEFWRGHRLVTGAVAIYFLVPTLPLLIRLRDAGTRNISRVDRFQLWIYRGLRVGLLLACFWLAFDPVTGARQMVHQQMGPWLAMLTLDYFNALGAGFLVGSLLLIAQDETGRDNYRRSRRKFQWKRLAVPLAAACCAVAILGLAVRNAPAIVRLNFHPLEQFGTQAVNSLPAGGGVVLSDYPDKLVVFQAALAHQRQAANWLAVDTHRLPMVAYRARLERHQPAAGWLTDSNRHELNPMEALRLLEQVARTNRLFYLHPSYGHFFEGFYLEPTGTIFEMKLRGKDPLDLPPMSTTAVEANEKNWSRLWNNKLAELAPPDRANRFEEKMARYGLVPAPRLQDRALAEWNSILLDYWGVTLQKQGRWPEAQVRLEQALRLNTNNLSARISLACNTNYQAGVKMGLSNVEKAVGQLGDPNRINFIVNNGGPFDEPTVDYVLGSVFLDHGQLLQAAEQFERIRTLAPGALAAELALAEIYNRLQMPDRGQPLINHLRGETRGLPANSSLDLNLALLESYSWLLQTNVANARDVLRSVVAQHPDDPQVNSRVLAAYLAFGDNTNALRLVEARLAKSPDDVTSLDNKAVILLQSGKAAEAIPILDHVLTLTNQPAARINRAFARIATKDFAQAETDLRAVEISGNNPAMANFGFAAVADSRHDTNQMIHYLQLCLSNTPAGTPLWQQATARLQMLETAGKAK